MFGVQTEHVLRIHPLEMGELLPCSDSPIDVTGHLAAQPPSRPKLKMQSKRRLRPIDVALAAARPVALATGVSLLSEVI